MTMTRAPSRSTDCAHQVHKFAGGKLRGIDLLDANLAGRPAFAETDPERFGPSFERGDALVERENDCVLAAIRRRHGVLRRDRRFAGTRRTHQQRAGAAIRSAAQERVQRGDAALDPLRLKACAVLRGDQSWENGETAPDDGKIVISVPKIGAAKFHHPHPAARGAVNRSPLLERDDAMDDALQLEVGRLGGLVVEQNHGALATDEELLQRQDLAPVA